MRRAAFGFEWMPWDDKIVYLDVDRAGASPPTFNIYDPANGSDTTFIELEAGRRIEYVSMSDDGKWIFYHQFDTTGSDIMLVENFSVDR